jgi:hypothetical protein
MNLDYAVSQHAEQNRPIQFAGLWAVAAIQFAHAVLAHRGEWVTNEKGLLRLPHDSAQIPNID